MARLGGNLTPAAIHRTRPEAGCWTTRSEEETRELGARLAADLPPGAVLLLSGDLGAGKTVLAQGIAKGLGLDPRAVVSPTYTLVHEHGSGAHRLVHVDLYRLAPEEVAAVGLEELLAGPGLKVVEWGERLPFEVSGAYRLKLELDREAGPGGRRTVRLSPPQDQKWDNGSTAMRGEREE